MLFRSEEKEGEDEENDLDAVDDPAPGIYTCILSSLTLNVHTFLPL